MARLDYLLHLLHLAASGTLATMGTTVLGFGASLLFSFVPAFTKWRKSKSRRAVRGVWQDSIRDGVYGLLLLWSVVFLCQLFIIQPEALATITVHKLFTEDFPYATIGLSETIANRESGETVSKSVEARVVLDMPANSKFIAIYVPMMGEDRAMKVCEAFSHGYQQVLDDADHHVEFGMGLPGEEMMRSKDLRFSRRLFVYYEDDLSLQQRAHLEQLYRQNDLVVQFRGQDYASSIRLGKPSPPTS